MGWEDWSFNKSVRKFPKSWLTAGIGIGMFALNHGLSKSEEYRKGFEDHWLKTLGYEGVPRLEMYKGESAEAEFDRDWREYWETHPDNHSIY